MNVHELAELVGASPIVAAERVLAARKNYRERRHRG